MTYHEKITNMSVDEMAVFFNNLLTEEDRKIQRQLASQGFNVSFCEMHPDLQVEVHIKFLESECDDI